MRKYMIMALLVLTALPAAAGGQKKESSPYKHEINVSWGWNPEEAMWQTFDFCRTGNNGVDYIYSNYISSKLCTGLISVDYNIQFKRWFALGAQLNAVAFYSTEMSSITDSVVSRYTDYAMSLLPYARFTYINRKNVKLYSSLGIGLGYFHDERPVETDYSSDRPDFMGIAAQFVPVGIMVGNRVYGMAELGTGTEYRGIRFGIGFRF